VRIPQHGPHIFSRIVAPNSILMAEVPSAERLGAYRQDLMAKSSKLSVKSLFYQTCFRFIIRNDGEMGCGL
jgi:hypothetical protein